MTTAFEAYLVIALAIFTGKILYDLVSTAIAFSKPYRRKIVKWSTKVTKDILKEMAKTDWNELMEGIMAQNNFVENR